MEYALMVAAGLAAGVLGGLLGVGGGAVMIPAMVWILGETYQGRVAMHQYQAASLIAIPLLIAPSVWVHWRNRAVWTGVWKHLTPGAGAGVVAGVLLGYVPMLSGTNTIYMQRLMGLFFLYVAGQNLLRLARPTRTEGVERTVAEASPWYLKTGIGAVMGVLSGLLGVGGGTVAVPAQQILLRMPLRSSIATSAATMVCTAWIGAIVKNAQLGENGDWRTSLLLAAVLTPTGMIGSYLGGHLTHKLPVRIVRIVFIALMLLSAWKLLTPHV